MNEKREMELAGEMREMIALGWTLDTFDQDFDKCESDAWNKDEKEDCRKIFLQVWDQVQEEKNMNEMKYFLDFTDVGFTLNEIETHDTIYCSTWEDAGIGDNDPDYTNKLDLLFSQELGIAPSEWEVG